MCSYRSHLGPAIVLAREIPYPEKAETGSCPGQESEEVVVVVVVVIVVVVVVAVAVAVAVVLVRALILLLTTSPRNGVVKSFARPGWAPRSTKCEAEGRAETTAYLGM